MSSETQNVSMLMNYRRVRDIKRCSTFPVLKPEDVAQHSYFVTLLAMMIVDEYNEYIQQFWIQDECEIPSPQRNFISTEKVLRKALLHDTDEAFTSDIPWNIKHYDEDTHEAITKAIEKRMDEAYEGTTELFLAYHDMATKCKDDFEGQIVDVADMVELAIHCWEECSMGNHWMKPLLDKCLNIIHGFVDGSELLDACPTFVELLHTLHKKPTEDIVKTLIDID